MKREFVNFFDKVSRVHGEMVTEIANIFKEHNVTKIHLNCGEFPLRLQMMDEWGESAYNREITDIEVIAHDSGMIEINLYKDNSNTYYDLGDCADGNALLFIYDYVWMHFYQE